MADNELLADYEDEPEYPTAAGAGTVATGGEESEKKNYAGIHSSGFRYTFSSPYYVRRRVPRIPFF